LRVISQGKSFSYTKVKSVYQFYSPSREPALYIATNPFRISRIPDIISFDVLIWCLEW